MNFISELESLNVARLKSAHKVLDDALTKCFENTNIDIIAWGQKSSEYDDEGMYEGFNGPVFNYDFIKNHRKDDYWNSLESEIIQGYGSYRRQDTPGWEKIQNFPAEEKILMDSLNAIGSKLIEDIIGDDENIVVATRQNDGYTLQAISSRY